MRDTGQDLTPELVRQTPALRMRQPVVGPLRAAKALAALELAALELSPTPVRLPR